jgi:hypothetical protein
MNIFGGITEKVRTYIELQIRLLKLNIIGHAGNLMGSVVFVLLALFVFCALLLFSGLGLAEVFADAGMSRAGAFFSVTGIFLLLFIFLIALGAPIRRFFSGIFIKGMTGAAGESSEPKN